MKRINFFVIFLLLFIFVGCFSINTFADTYGGKKFPVLPDDLDLDDVVTIIYYPHNDRYYLFISDSVEYGEHWFDDALNYRGSTKTYKWDPKSGNSWEFYAAYDNGVDVVYELGGDGKYYDGSGNEIILLHSNVDIMDKNGDFFFQGNDISVFYEHAIDFYGDDLEDDSSGWWNAWGSLANFWDSISGFLGSALSPLFSVMETIGDIFEGFLGGLIDIYDAITDFFENFGSKLIDALKSLFIPEEGFLEDNLSDIKDTFSNKFGVAIEMKDSILDAFDQVVHDEFAGIKINFDNSFLPISGEYYVVDPGPVNQYGDRVKPWISGLMIFFTVTYILKQIVIIIRGR